MNLRDQKELCKRLGIPWHKIIKGLPGECSPDLNTPDGAHLAMQKCKELGEWDKFATIWLWDKCIEEGNEGFHNILTDPSRRCEAILAYLREKDK